MSTRHMMALAGAALILGWAVPAQAQFTKVAGNNACGAGMRIAELADVQRDPQKACGALGEWDIARLGKGGSLSGKGYGCKANPNDKQPIGDSLCVPAAGTAANTPAAPAGAQAGCAPEPGWQACTPVVLPGATVKIFSTGRVSPKARNAAQLVYATMLGALKAPYDVKKFDGYKVYMTNGEPWADLKKRPPMGFMGSDEENDELRGGTTIDFLWITEQMMCKTGVATRNAAFKAGKRKDPDNEVRAFDQVVHEMAHAIDMKFNLEPMYKRPGIYPGLKDFGAVEQWAWGVQNLLGHPAAQLNPQQTAFLNRVFNPVQVSTITCAVMK